MKLHQLRYLVQIVDSGFNVTVAAKTLFTSQSGISRQVRLLESELGAQVLLREGNRIVGLTEPGEEIVTAARRLLTGVKNLKEIPAALKARNSGSLVIATPHLHARFSLQPTIAAFCKKYPNVTLKLSQLYPAEIDRVVAANEADIGVSAADESPETDLVKLPAYSTFMHLHAPKGHSLLKLKRPTLLDVARYPLIVLDRRISSGAAVSRAFERHQITPNVVMTATNTDVIRAYVASGLGVAFLRRLPLQPPEHAEIRTVEVNHLFAPSMTYVLLRRDKYLSNYMYDFIEMISPKWTPKRVKAEMAKG